jgi:hypothetical protein
MARANIPVCPGYGFFYSQEQENSVILVSYVLMGMPYPVIEDPYVVTEKVKDFDSHYVLVDRQVPFISATDSPL